VIFIYNLRVWHWLLVVTEHRPGGKVARKANVNQWVHQHLHLSFFENALLLSILNKIHFGASSDNVNFQYFFNYFWRIILDLPNNVFITILKLKCKQLLSVKFKTSKYAVNSKLFCWKVNWTKVIIYTVN